MAFFPDSLGEINGVARTCGQLLCCATSHRLPLLCVHAGPAPQVTDPGGTVQRCELQRGRWSFGLERDLRFDLRLWRHLRRVRSEVEAFGPDLIHITGPSDVGQMGAYLAHRLRVPLVASWHTNVHDFAACRFDRLLSPTPARVRRRVVEAARRHSLSLTLDFSRMARILLAPNEDLSALLRARTRRPVFPMRRGVDANLFNPGRRTATGVPFRIGYVGRLSPEKHVRQLAEIEEALTTHGPRPFRFTIVGDGSERPWLERHLTQAGFLGVLTGENLATAYANMDLFVLPSQTDTYGNVVQEACASGTPAAVTHIGGPRYLVRDGVNGAVANGTEGSRDLALAMMRNPGWCADMRAAARARALNASWDRGFEEVYRAYEFAFAPASGAAPAGVPWPPDRLSLLARLVKAAVNRSAASPAARPASSPVGAGSVRTT